MKLFELLFQESIVDDVKKKYPSLAQKLEKEFGDVPSKYWHWSAKQLLTNPSDPFFSQELSSLVKSFDMLARNNRLDKQQTKTDINAYKDVAELAKTIQAAASRLTRGDEKKLAKKAKSAMETETKILVNNSKYLITQPNSWEDSCNLGVAPSKEEAEEEGEGKYWCISNPYKKDSWNHYREKGVRFFFINSKQRNESDPYNLIAVAKWPSGTLQITDSENNLVDEEKLTDILNGDWETIKELIVGF